MSYPQSRSPSPKNGTPAASSAAILQELPKGIVTAHQLPHPPFAALWDAIRLDPGTKDRLLSQAIVTFQLRPKVDPARVPLHGLIVLVGPPGTGKTSLARGLASRTAESLPNLGGTFRYLEIDPHALMSAGLGRSQQGVQKLLAETIPEHAGRSPMIVLVDEIEALATDRIQLSFDANPVDVHRATDAVLSGMDRLASMYPKLLFLATTNFETAVDAALLSRADLVQAIPLPSADAAREILADTVRALATLHPDLERLVQQPSFNLAAAACAGLDGRQIRKVPIAALTFDKQTAIHPERLSCADLVRAAEGARRGGHSA